MSSARTGTGSSSRSRRPSPPRPSAAGRRSGSSGKLYYNGLLCHAMLYYAV